MANVRWLYNTLSGTLWVEVLRPIPTRQELLRAYGWEKWLELWRADAQHRNSNASHVICQFAQLHAAWLTDIKGEKGILFTRASSAAVRVSTVRSLLRPYCVIFFFFKCGNE